MQKKKEDNYDFVKPKHYELWKNFDTWKPYTILTKEEFIGFCKGNILKYQLRLGKKPNNPIEQDMAKIKIYEEKLNELLNKSDE